MSDWVMLIPVFAVGGVFCWIVSTIGNKIVDKSGDAIENHYKRKKNAESAEKKENLADRYRK